MLKCCTVSSHSSASTSRNPRMSTARGPQGQLDDLFRHHQAMRGKSWEFVLQCRFAVVLDDGLRRQRWVSDLTPSRSRTAMKALFSSSSIRVSDFITGWIIVPEHPCGLASVGGFLLGQLERVLNSRFSEDSGVGRPHQDLLWVPYS